MFPKLSRKDARGVLLAFVVLIVAGPAVAQDVPRIFYFDVDRTVRSEVFGGTIDTETDELVGAGSWSRENDAALVTPLASGSASASQKSVVTDLGFQLQLEATHEATAGPTTFDPESWTGLSAFISVDVATTASLKGTLTLEGTSGVQAIIQVGSTVSLFFDDDDIGPLPVIIDEQIPLDAGDFVLIDIQISSGGPIFDESTNSTVTLDLAFDVGDADADGLPDVWEEDGIDFDGDGNPEIDLPAMGADPLRKDCFVEVDVHSASNFPTSRLSDVVTAFANAPTSNPDGTTGITLHPMVDETNLSSVSYTVANLPSEIAAQKTTSFGTPTERAHPDWASTGRDLKLQAFRYGVIGGVLDTKWSGWSEIFGDDFVVTTDDPGFSAWTDDDLVATFMHELGHALGLRHGGIDDLNYKPNYVSVMNYAFQVPSTLAASANPQLDYSRFELATLDESSLIERTGFGGAPTYYADKQTPFNTSVSPDPNAVDYASPVDGSVDFDGDGTIAASGTQSADLTWIRPSDARTPDQVLVGHDDWANVNLALFGSDNFGAGVSGGPTVSDPEVGSLTDAAYAELADALGGGAVTSVEPDAGDGSLRLAVIGPNPVSDRAVLEFAVTSNQAVALTIYDTRGRRVRTLVDGVRAPGAHSTIWTGTDDQGRNVASGLYFAVLRSGAEAITRKVTFVR